MEDIEQINEGVNSESSPTSQETPSAVENEAPKDTSTPEANVKSDDSEVPFHKHPRFQELVEQKNRYADSYKQLEQKYADMERRISEMSQPQKAAKEQDALIARLKEIDPEFAERFETLDKTREQIAELSQWKQAQEYERVRSNAVNTINTLHSQNKVSAEMQEFYNSQLEARYMQNPQAFLKDIQGAYKSIHEQVSKILDARDRAARESYVTDKKKATNVPASQPKGKPASKGGTSEYSSDPAEARSQLISRVLKQAKASNSI